MKGESQVAEQSGEIHALRLQEIARLRMIVGYLGEKSQHNWWSSEFFSATAPAFLNPVFGKTATLAQYHGVKEAARYAAAYDHAKNCSSESAATMTMISAALSGNISEARKVLDSDVALKENPANVALLSVLEGNYDKAQIELDQETEATFLYETGAKHLVCGLIAEHNGELKKAVEEFDLALQLYADSTFVKAEMLRVMSKHGKHARTSAHLESLDVARAETLNSIQWGPATLLGFALLWLGIFFNYVRTEKLRSAHDYFIFQRESTSPCS